MKSVEKCYSMETHRYHCQLLIQPTELSTVDLSISHPTSGLLVVLEWHKSVHILWVPLTRIEGH